MTHGPGRPPKELQRDGRQSLLNAARDLIREEGIERLTLRAIAARAGLGSALVNYYFGNKEGLKEAVVEQAVSELRARILIEEVRGLPPDQELRAMLIQMIRGLGEEPYIARMVVELIAAGDESILQKLASNVALPNIEIVKRIFARGRSQGIFRDVQIDLVAPAVMGASLYPLVVAPLLKAFLNLDLSKAEHLQRFAEQTAELLLDGLMVRG